MMREKGKDPKLWNWQMREDRNKDEVEEEQQYIDNVEAISHHNYPKCV